RTLGGVSQFAYGVAREMARGCGGFPRVRGRLSPALRDHRAAVVVAVRNELARNAPLALARNVECPRPARSDRTRLGLVQSGALRQSAAVRPIVPAQSRLRIAAAAFRLALPAEQRRSLFFFRRRLDALFPLYFPWRRRAADADR